MMDNVVAVTTILLAVALAVMLHYEGLSTLSKRHAGPSQHLGHRAMVVVVFWLFALHVAEIWLFGLAYWALIHHAGSGGISGMTDTGLLGRSTCRRPPTARWVSATWRPRARSGSWPVPKPSSG